MSGADRDSKDALHPSVDAARWEAAVHAIVARATPELERRAAAQSPVLTLARWSRPVLSAAATVALLASAAILSRALGADGPAGSEGAATAEASVAGVLFPAAMSDWLVGGEAESVVALVQAMEEGR
jgi:hypothetical protein